MRMFLNHAVNVIPLLIIIPGVHGIFSSPFAYESSSISSCSSCSSYSLTSSTVSKLTYFSLFENIIGEWETKGVYGVSSIITQEVQNNK